MFLALFAILSQSRSKSRVPGKFNKDNDPVHYMRELEFRNTIDQYDLAIVLFFKKDVDECKTMLPGFRYSAYKARGKADYIAISAKSAADLIDELAVDKFPTIFSFRNGHLIEKIENKTQPKDLYFYVKNITAAKYKYINTVEEVESAFHQKNATMLFALPQVDLRMDKLIGVVTAKFYEKCQFLVAPNEEIAAAFNVTDFPSITLFRIHDDSNISFPNEPKKATVKSLTDFVEKNIEPRYQLLNSFQDIKDKPYFVALYDTANHKEVQIIKPILETISTEFKGQFPIRYGDGLQLRRNLTYMHLENRTLPIFMFVKTGPFSYMKWVFTGKSTPKAIAAFCADQIRNRNKETIVDYPIANKPKGSYKYMTGSELEKAMTRQTDKDFVVNFVGFPCINCAMVDELFSETAEWAKSNGIRSVVFARVNASCNDVPHTVWRNETYPYGWMFQAKNRSAAFPIGKRRQLYWMVHLLKDNMSKPFEAELPPKPSPTPRINIDL